MYDEAHVKAIIDALARYLRDNPRACDTAEGIRRWWLPPDLECTDEAVSVALEWMKRQQLIDMTTAADGRQRFSRTGTGDQFDAVLGQSGGDETAA
jgi:hypothetical protein